MRISKIAARRDGKFLVTQVSQGGRVFRSIMDRDQLAAERDKEANAPQLTQSEIARRSIPFGQAGYVGR